MLIELRNYKAIENARGDLIDHLETEVAPLMDRVGGQTVGFFRDVEDPASCWVFRSYTDQAQRKAINTLAGSSEWSAIGVKLKELSLLPPSVIATAPTASSRFQGQRGGSGGASARVMEIRLYKTHPGVRESYVKHFEARVLPSFENRGAWIAAQLISLDDPDSFIWLWPFADRAAQADDQNAIYGSEMWRSSLRAPTIAFLADYSNVVTVEPTERSEFQG